MSHRLAHVARCGGTLTALLVICMAQPAVAQLQIAEPTSPKQAHQLIFAAFDGASFEPAKTRIGGYRGLPSNVCLTRYQQVNHGYVYTGPDYPNGLNVPTEILTLQLDWSKATTLDAQGGGVLVRGTDRNWALYLTGERGAKFMAGGTYLLRACRKPQQAQPASPNASGGSGAVVAPRPVTDARSSWFCGGFDQHYGRLFLTRPFESGATVAALKTRWSSWLTQSQKVAMPQSIFCLSSPTVADAVRKRAEAVSKLTQEGSILVEAEWSDPTPAPVAPASADDANRRVVALTNGSPIPAIDGWGKQHSAPGVYVTSADGPCHMATQPRYSDLKHPSDGSSTVQWSNVKSVRAEGQRLLVRLRNWDGEWVLFAKSPSAALEAIPLVRYLINACETGAKAPPPTAAAAIQSKRL